MEEFNTLVGIRLKKIRHIFNEGGRLTAEQFAYLIGESGDKIRNYELGRSALPLRVVWILYERGINPVYLISGEGSVFADNHAGRVFKSKVEARNKITGDVELINIYSDKKSINEKSYKHNEDIGKYEIPVVRAAAGRINIQDKDKE
jgi:hypothetical protein